MEEIRDIENEYSSTDITETDSVEQVIAQNSDDNDSKEGVFDRFVKPFVDATTGAIKENPEETRWYLALLSLIGIGGYVLLKKKAA